jgi:hypothetical protein
MYKKIIISLIVSVCLLTLVTILASAQGANQGAYQMDMSTPTPTLPPEPTPVSDLPLSGDVPLTGAQTGTCPMMSGTDMTGMNMGGTTGMNMNGMAGMQGTSNMGGMSGMNMGGMAGMQGMSGMQGMNSMQGMGPTGMTGSPMYYSTPWYANPWWLLGWVLLILVMSAILAGLGLGIRGLIRSRQTSTDSAA